MPLTIPNKETLTVPQSQQLVTKNVGTGRNQLYTLYIILAAFPGARQLTFVEERNDSWIQFTIPPTLPYFTNGETVA